ncbi:portal protein [Mycobacterium phage DrLupo]|uniref:Portal protein n=1 Tax=Mycobacterium phage DrLupo TaxID=2499037 RepID=A0A3S9UQI4_9CAUD|nr:portal protein [Mycobacterium phage DrLupo]AZS12543.1 portal protein [Mycobacterium phage DrLupo]
MPYNPKQYDPAKPFLRGGDDNIVDENDKNRIRAYDLYENIYLNSAETLKLVLRGDDSVPILMPSGRKIVEAVHRFLGVGFDYLVEPDRGDEGVRQSLDVYFRNLFKREAVKAKFTSNKRWGLIRGDAHFYIHADPNKKAGERLSIEEVDPRQVFLIEEGTSVVGFHMVDIIQDFRAKDDPSKKIARRRTFRRVKDDAGNFTGRVSSELTHWTLGNWDDRGAIPDETARLKERVVSSEFDEEVEELPEPISQLPLYRWRNKPPQNSTWGTSQLEGMETLAYALNQSLTDEDATIVFQGLGMYVTNASPPVDPNTGELTDWNIGPMQIIEIPGSAQDQYFNRVSGVQDISPFQDHMRWIDEKGIAEGSGTPEVAIGRVDVTSAESGISLELQLKPLLAANEEKELELIVVMDQMLHDIATMWLPAYEGDYEDTIGGGRPFASADLLNECSVVCVFADPMPVNKTQVIQDTLLLQQSHLILRKMAVAKLRSIGWEYPATDAEGRPLTDDDIADMLLAEAEADASVGMSALDSGGGGEFDEQGNPIDQFGNSTETPPDVTQVPLNA